jgi:hypothetical protein
MPWRCRHHADIGAPTSGKRRTQRILEVNITCLEVRCIGIGDIRRQEFLAMGQHAERDALNLELLVNPVNHGIGRKVLKKKLRGLT